MDRKPYCYVDLGQDNKKMNPLYADNKAHDFQDV